MLRTDNSQMTMAESTGEEAIEQLSQTALPSQPAAREQLIHKGTEFIESTPVASGTSSQISEEQGQADRPTTPFDNLADVARSMDGKQEIHRRKMEGSMVFLAQCVDRLADNLEEDTRERRARDARNETQHSQIIDDQL
ncbi:uncharacterized protein LOC134956766 isoform X2 [Pseudophryne corroboree]|uniref:uncharacterized protein LOC134956766 isoform X2 n=1 Tax=Pseudophryne corroboree TaxID=495146 RepID=UPI0030817364